MDKETIDRKIFLSLMDLCRDVPMVIKCFGEVKEEIVIQLVRNAINATIESGFAKREGENLIWIGEKS